MDRTLRFGVFMAPFHALDTGPTLFFRHDLELIDNLDRLGFDEAWIGEHHSGGFEMIGAPEVFIAAAAERTKRIRLGTGVKSLPMHHPFIVAETMVQLDHMTQGRTMFGVGPGALPTDSAMLGIDVRDTRRMMGEALEVIVRLLAGERVTKATDWFRLDDARLQLDCYTRPRMEMAVTTVRSPSGARAAGRHGLGMLSLGGVSEEALAAYDANWRVCEETAARHGQTVDRRNFRVAIFMHLADSVERARKDVRFGIDAWARYARDILPFSPVPAGVADVREFLIENRGAVIGTPADAIAAIERAQAGSGGFGVVLLMAHDWADWSATQRSYELFARHVIPHFQGGLDGRRTSYDFSKRRLEGLRSAAQEGLAAARENKGSDR
jgi:limonene 1,2-monooxygenase